MPKQPRMNAKVRATKAAGVIGVPPPPSAVKANLFDRVAAILEQARGNARRTGHAIADRGEYADVARYMHGVDLAAGQFACERIEP